MKTNTLSRIYTSVTNRISKFNSASLVGILFLFMSFGFSNQAEASHFRHGSISWQVVSGNTIEFKVTQAWANYPGWNVGDYAYQDRLYFGDGTAQYFQVEITAVNGPDNWVYGETTFQHTYANAGNFTAYFASCCKIGGLSNNNGSRWRNETIVNVGSTNSSPVTTMAPIINMQQGLGAATFQVPAADPDGDNLTYRLATYAEISGGQPAGFSISPTGLISFNTSSTSINQLWNAAIVVEDGQSKVINDFIIKIVQQSAAPQFDYAVTPASGTIYQVSPGDLVAFDVKAIDTDPGSTVTLQGLGLPAGAALSPALPTSGPGQAQTSFSWTPSSGNLGTNVINFLAEDEFGAQTSSSVSIIVSLKPVFDVPPTPATGAHNIVVAPGSTISYTVQASDPDPADVVQITKAEGKAMSGAHIPLYAGASFSTPTASGNPTSGTFSWTTQASDWGHKHVFFTAVDSYGDEAEHEVYQLINTVPGVSSSPVTSGDVGQPYSYTMVSNDPDLAYGDQVTFVNNGSLPSWMTLTTDPANGTATISGTPGINDGGTYNLSFLVEDIHHHHGTSIPTHDFTLVINDCTVSAQAQDITVAIGTNGIASIETSAEVIQTIFEEDFNNDAGGNINTLEHWNVLAGNLDAANFIISSPGNEIDMAGTSNATIETKSALTLSPGTYRLSFIHLTNSNPNPNNNLEINIGSLYSGSFPAPSSVVAVSEEFYVSSATSAKILMQETGTNDNSGTFIGSIKLEKVTPASYTIDAGSAATCGVSSITVSQSDFACSEVGTHTVTLTITDVNGTVESTTAQVTVTGTDTDGDGVCDAADLDDDNDGVLDSEECPPSQFYWSQGLSLSGNTATGTINGVNYTYTSSHTVQTEGGYQNHGWFPASFGVPNNNAIMNTQATSNTLTFDQPLLNPTFVFASIGSGGQSVTVDFDQPIEVLWSQNVVLNTPTRITGTEGFAIVRYVGTFSSASFDYNVAEFRANFGFGADFSGVCDADADGTQNQYQLDSDADGCSDVLEAGHTDPDNDGILGTSPVVVDAQGLVVNQGGYSGTNNAVTDDQDYTACNVAPVAVCMNATLNTGANCDVTVTVADVDGGSYDDDGDVLTYSLSNAGPHGVGTHTVTLTVTDPDGETSTCTATVTVEDNSAPVASAMDITVQLDANGNATIVPSDVDNGSSDNCAIASLDFCTVAGDNGGQTSVQVNSGTRSGPNLTGITYTYNGQQHTLTPQDAIGSTIVLSSLTAGSGNANRFWNTAGGPITEQAALNYLGDLDLSTALQDCADPAGVRHEVIFDSPIIPGEGPEVFIVHGGLNYNIEFFDLNGNTVVVVPNANNASSQVTIGGSPVSSGFHGYYLRTKQPFYAQQSGGHGNGQNKVLALDLNPSDIANIAGIRFGGGGCNYTYEILGFQPQASQASQLDFTCADVGVQQVTLCVTDVNGNASSTTSTVTVVDNVAPVASAMDITVQLDVTGNVSIVAADVDNGSSDACGIANLSVSPSSFACADVGANTVTLTVTDNNGNVSTTTSTITVEDNIAPTVLTQNLTAYLDANGNVTVPTSSLDAGSSDNCGIETLTCIGGSSTSGSATGDNLAMGTFSGGAADIVEYSNFNATNYRGSLGSTCNEAWYARGSLCDNGSAQHDPTLSYRASSNAGGTWRNLSPNSSYGILVIDLGQASLIQEASVFQMFSDGKATHIEIFGHGQTSTAPNSSDPGWLVMAPKTLLGPGTNLGSGLVGDPDLISLNSLNTRYVKVHVYNDNRYGSPSWIELRSIKLFGSNADCSFTCADVGANTVTIQATDFNGNVASNTAIVTILDTISPVVLAKNITVQLDAAGNTSITAADVDNGSNDACGIASLSVSPSSFTCTEVGANTVTLTVTDNSGNVSTTTSTVTVEDNVAPVATTMDITIQLDASGSAAIVAADVDNGSSDACGVASLAVAPSSFDCSNVGANTVTLTVTDVNGNVSTATAVVTVEDNILPTVLTMNASVTLLNGTASITPADVDNGSFDNCAIANLSVSPNTWDCDDIGDHTVTLTATDVNGNVSSNTATVTVNGQVPTVSIASVPTDNTYTGGNPNNLYLGYGAQSTVLSTTVANGTSFTYAWTGQDLDCYNCPNPEFTPTTEGLYTFTVLVTNENGCTVSEDIVICVKDIRGNKKDKVYLCHVPPGNPSKAKTLYISVNAVPAHLGNHAGDFLGDCDQVCGNASRFEAPDGDLYGTGDIELIVYPNPTSENFKLDIETSFDDEINVRVMDLGGRILESHLNVNAAQTLEFGQDLASGFYLVSIQQGEYSEVIRVEKLN